MQGYVPETLRGVPVLACVIPGLSSTDIALEDSWCRLELEFIGTSADTSVLEDRPERYDMSRMYTRL